MRTGHGYTGEQFVPVGKTDCAPLRRTVISVRPMSSDVSSSWERLVTSTHTTLLGLNGVTSMADVDCSRGYRQTTELMQPGCNLQLICRVPTRIDTYIYATTAMLHDILTSQSNDFYPCAVQYLCHISISVALGLRCLNSTISHSYLHSYQTCGMFGSPFTRLFS